MECRSCLSDPEALLVADASVAINLNASGYSEAILDALPNPFVVVEEVVLELENGRRFGRSDADALMALVHTGRTNVVQLGEAGMAKFANLVSGSSAQTLDDGEAATIACALERGGTALIDERKANRICADRYSKLPMGSSVDLFLHERTRAALGTEDLADAVFNALFNGRMRVHERHREWVLNLIGHKRAAKCKSLPWSLRNENKAWASAQG